MVSTFWFDSLLCIHLLLGAECGAANYDLEHISSPVDSERLTHFLHITQYDRNESMALIQGFRDGFSIGYNGPKNRQSRSRNIPFTPGVGDKAELWQKIMAEVGEFRVAGPFDEIPFTNFIQSPVGLIPKSSNRTRLIFHLSFDFGEHKNDKSLNYFTPKDICTVKYNDLDHAIRCCLAASSRSADGSVWLSKTDLRSAFRMLLVRSQDWPWLVFKAENPETGKYIYFVDKCLPFGASISCALFQKFSNALRHILSSITNKMYAVTNYLDDFLFTEVTRNDCNRMVTSFLQVCCAINLPVAHDKTEWASQQVVFLGILIDGSRLVLSVPLVKKDRALELLNMFKDKKKAKVHQLQKLTGYLNFLSRAIHPGQAFTRRIYSKYLNVIGKDSALKKHHHIRLDKEFKFDCEVWRIFVSQHMSQAVCRPLIDIDGISSSQELDFYSDLSAAETLGFGVIYKRHWMFGRWPVGFLRRYKPNIAYLELFALVTGILAWETELQNLRMMVFCDNKSVIDMINATSSKCPNCMYLIRVLVLSGLRYNRRVYATYINTKLNSRADALSRLKIDRFLLLSEPTIDAQPTTILEQIWPIDKIWQQP